MQEKLEKSDYKYYWKVLSIIIFLQCKINVMYYYYVEIHTRIQLQFCLLEKNIYRNIFQVLQEKFHTFLYLKRIDLRKSVVKLFTYVSSSEYHGLLGS